MMSSNETLVDNFYKVGGALDADAGGRWTPMRAATRRARPTRS
jgi:hypothetical protein